MEPSGYARDATMSAQEDEYPAPGDHVLHGKTRGLRGARMTSSTGRPDAPPSVLFLTRVYPPLTGGMEELSYNLTTSVATRTRTHIIAHQRRKALLPLFFPFALGRALPQLSAFDILHISDPVLAGLAWTLRRFRDIPAAVTMHGLDIVYPSAFYQWYLRRFLPPLDLFICISTYVETMFRERTGITRSVVITPGVHDMFYRPETKRDSLTALLGTNIGSRPILLTLGRLVKRKGVSWFIRHVLPRLSPDILYIVAGDGPDALEAKRAAAETGTTSRVLFLGAVTDEQRRILYNTADLFIMPNIVIDNDTEGFGIVALEAATCQLPVLASGIQGIPDAVQDEKNGVLVSAGDGDAYVQRIQRLLTNTDERTGLGNRARTHTLERFSWSTIAQQYLDAFAQLRKM